MDPSTERKIVELLKEKPYLLKEPIATIADLIGLDNALKVAKEFGKTSLYIPEFRTTCKMAIDQLVRQEFNGENQEELANKYGYCTRSIIILLKQE